ncbi:MAG: TonB-dependent receptor plug domain-containing protein [Asticcacaulis sp.]
MNSTFTGFVVDGGDGINTLSLRGLGAQRSLILLNGRRMPPAGVSGTVGPVDLNFIPQSMVPAL